MPFGLRFGSTELTYDTLAEAREAARRLSRIGPVGSVRRYVEARGRRFTIDLDSQNEYGITQVLRQESVRRPAPELVKPEPVRAEPRPELPPDPQHAYYNPAHPDHQAAVQEVTTAFQRAYPTEKEPN